MTEKGHPEIDGNELDLEFELEDELDLEEGVEGADEFDEEAYFEKGEELNKSTTETPSSEKKPTSILKILFITMGGIIVIGILSIVGWTMLSSRSVPTTSLQPKEVAPLPMAQAQVQVQPPFEDPLKDGLTPVEINPTSSPAEAVTALPTPMVAKEELTVEVVKTLLDDVFEKYDKNNQERFDDLSKTILGMGITITEVSKIVAEIGPGNSISKEQFEELTAQLDTKTTEIEGAKAQLKDYRGKNIWLRSIELKHRKEIKNLRKQIGQSKISSLENFIAFTSSWHLAAISSQVAVFSDVNGKLLQLRNGEQFEGLTIKEINPSENFVKTSGGKIFYVAG
jgi:hypothetical protein